METNTNGISDYDTSAYVSDGLKITNIHFVNSKSDLEDLKLVFKPTYCHQVYNANETIFGYKNLEIDIYYNRITWTPYVEIKYKDKIKESLQYEIKADNVNEMIKQWLPEDAYTEKEDFLKDLGADKGKMMGKIKAKFDLKVNDEMSQFTITKITDVSDEFKALHDKFERVLVWYINAASLIDMEDPRWTYFYVYEQKGNNVYPIGFCTIYLFFKYPDKNRARISQFFILPTHQRQGLGTRLLQTVYETFQSKENIYDITVEDPSDEFKSLRDLVDCKLLKDLPEFSKEVILKRPFYEAAGKVAVTKYKLYREQAQRVYEILNFLYAEMNVELIQECCKRIISRFTSNLKKEGCPPTKKKRFHQIQEQIEKVNNSVDVEIMFKRLEDYVEEIFPIVFKLKGQREKEDMVKQISELRKIWDKMQVKLD